MRKIRKDRQKKQTPKSPSAQTAKHAARVSKRRALASKTLNNALALRELGYAIVPIHGVVDGRCTCSNPKCTHPGKHPIIMGGVNAATRNRAKIREWLTDHPDANIGIAIGDRSGIIVLDIDPRNGGYETLADRETELGALPKTPRTLTGGGGEHQFFVAPPFTIKRDTAGKLLGPGVDVLTNGSFVIVPPSLHASGKRYTHDPKRSLLDSMVLELPKAWQARLRKAPSKGPPSPGVSLGEVKSPIAIGSRNNTLTKIGGYLVNTALSDEAVAQCLMLINQRRCKPPLDETDVRTIAESVLGYRPPAIKQVFDSREYVALAMLLAEHFEGGKHLRFLPGHDYHHYDGTKWVPIETHAIEHLALKIVEEQPTGSVRKVTTTLSDVMRLLAIKQTTDANTLYGDVGRPVINCLNGELWIGDNGEVDFRKHNPKSNLTTCLPVIYDPKARAPRYDKALRQIFAESDNPNDMARHWNELAGYLIQTQRDIPLILLLLGSGANGKTALWITLAALIGEEFVFSGSLSQLENRFMIGFLRGKLLFVDDDIKAGARLPDGTLKKLSEGKPLTGELKNQNAFTFINRALPILVANNEPTTSDLSHGMARRIMVIPFTHRFREGKDLDRALWPAIRRDELSGILNRYVRGLQRLRRRGSRFKLPSDVRAAKRAWFRNANPLKAFLHECTARDRNSRLLVASLFEAYNHWARDNGITYQLQRNTMSKQLKHLGFNVGRTKGGAAVIGMKLRD